MNFRIILCIIFFASGSILAQSNKSLYDSALNKAKSGKYTAALQELNKFIALNSKHIPSRELRANIYDEIGDYIKALDEYKYLLTADIQAIPQKRAEYFESIGYDYLRLGEYSKGREQYKLANTLNGNNVNILFNIGYSFKKDKMYDSSIVYFDKVLSIDKNHTLSLRNKIQALHLNLNTEQAYALSEEFLNTNKFDIDIILTRASILKSQGKINLALADYMRALISDPEDETALFGVSECYVSLGYYEEDLILKQRMVDLFKSNKESNVIVANSLFLLASAYKFLGDFDNAIKSFDESELLNPKDATVILERGLAKVSKKDLEGACQDFNKARNIDATKTSEYEEFITDDVEYSEFVKYCSILN